MTGEPMSTQHVGSRPSEAAERVNIAERYATFADYAAFTSSLPQTAATTLDVARFHAFTGELTFSVEPAVRLYLDGGSVYHAERDGDPEIGRLLLDAGVIDSMQLQRGVVRVGDVDHLGRLFDRDATVDRDAVMVVVEGATEALLQQIANSVIATVAASAYRHHPSGVHRWFVAPESLGVQRPASGVTQVDRSVVEELPRLGVSDAHPQHDDQAVAPMSIEWTHPDPTVDHGAGHGDDEPVPTPSMDIDIQAELDRFDADRADWSATTGGIESETADGIPSPLGEFHIVWPDGTRDPALTNPPAPDAGTVGDDDVAQPGGEDGGHQIVEPEADAPTIAADEGVGEAATDAADRSTGFDAPPAPAPFPTPSGAMAPFAPPDQPPAPTAPVGFSIEPLRIERIPEPNAAIPDDVAAAVRRALQAIESSAPNAAGSDSASSPHARVAMPELTMPRFATPAALESASAETPVLPAPAPEAPVPQPQAPPPPATPAPAPLGFAPPTMDMRAEVVHERAAAAAVAAELPVSSADPALPSPAAQAPAPGPVDETQDRRGALRRLIGSLRNND